MDESKDLDRVESLDESFVAGALHREQSHRERVIDAQRRQAEARAERYRAEMDLGLEQAHRSRRRWRSGRAPVSVPPVPSRRRKAVGVCITVAVLLAAYLPTQLAHGGVRPVPIGLGPASPQPVSCPKSVYPAGAEYRFERCWDGQPIGWGRCATVTVSVDPSGAPAPLRADTTDVLGQLSDATGLRFRSVTSAGQISIGWASTIVSPGNGPADKAGVTRVRARSSAAGAVLVSGAIQVSSRLTGGVGPNGEVPVLLHELGHAVGLGHYLGPEVMNPVDQGYATYQSGDLAGLARLYPPGGCT